ncbi:MAG: hypothetical protein U0Q16_39735 [Bryobacteraceae bacterium]
MKLSQRTVATQSRWSAWPVWIAVSGSLFRRMIALSPRGIREAALFDKAAHVSEGESAQIEFTIPGEVRVQPEGQR